MTHDQRSASVGQLATLALTAALVACQPSDRPPSTATADTTAAPGTLLPEPDRRRVLALLGIEQDGNGQLVDRECRQPVQLQEFIVEDLDGDGRAEVRVLGGNSCTSGGAGQSLAILVPDRTDGHRVALLFPAAGYDLSSVPGSLPDVRIQGLRPCTAVWRWRGGAYVHLQNEPLVAGGCDG